MAPEEPPGQIRSHIRISSAGQHPDSWGTPGRESSVGFRVGFRSASRADSAAD
jgi:hypothetical protein